HGSVDAVGQGKGNRPAHHRPKQIGIVEIDLPFVLEPRRRSFGKGQEARDEENGLDVKAIEDGISQLQRQAVGYPSRRIKSAQDMTNDNGKNSNPLGVVQCCISGHASWYPLALRMVPSSMASFGSGVLAWPCNALLSSRYRLSPWLDHSRQADWPGLDPGGR